MDWLAARPERRADPRVAVARRCVPSSCSASYGPDENPLRSCSSATRRDLGLCAGDDYHDLIKKRLKALARWLVATSGGEVKVFVDTAAVIGKAAGAGGGAGLAGQAYQPGVARLRLMAVSRRDFYQPRSAARRSGHRSLRLVLGLPRHLSTNAFPAPYKLDARRCISYLTIESKVRYPKNFEKRSATASMAATIASRPARGTNSRKPAARSNLPRAKTCARHKLSELVRLDDSGFRELFAKSPVKRVGRDRFIRNVLIAIGNSQDAALADAAKRLLGDESALVRGAAVWALSQLMPRDEFDSIAADKGRRETDECVRAEWTNAAHP